MVEFAKNDTITVLGCSDQHFCHTVCLDSWIKENTDKNRPVTCVFCRLEINQNKMSKRKFAEIKESEEKGISLSELKLQPNKGDDDLFGSNQDLD